MKKLISDMENCEQTTGLSVLAHGESVHSYFLDLRNHVLFGKDLSFNWRLPDWASDKSLWKRVVDMITIKNYQVYHDCGKPYCLSVDEGGRRHFIDHASVSARTWEKYGHPP